MLLPVLGFLFCLGIWISLPGPAKRIGFLWLAVGLAYHAISTREFRRPPPVIDLPEP
jgi:putrescine importer